MKNELMKKSSLIFSVLIFLLLSYIYFPESIDDAYITLRFSKNFFLGNGPVFNIGEAVEGYSNFSWMVILGMVGHMGIPMEIGMKFLSFISGLGTLIIVWKLAINWFKSAIATATAVILLGVSSFFAMWSVDGLETMFYTLLVTALIYMLTTTGISSVLIGTVAGIVALTRPEGIMFSLIAVVYLTFRQGFISGFKAFVPVAVCVGGYEAFRIFYFGEFVSNTAIAKIHPSLTTVVGGLRYFYAYNAASGYLVIPLALIGAIYAKNTKLSMPIIFILAQVLFLAVSGGDFMYGYRFVVPIMPCIALLCANAIDKLWGKRFDWVLTSGVFMLVITPCAYFQYINLPTKYIGFDNITFRSSPHFTIANFLAKNTSATDWVLLSECGIIPYYINANIVDYLGLTSRFYSVYKKDSSIKNEYIFSHKPKFVILSFVEDQVGLITPRMQVESEIQAHPEFQQRYTAIQNFDIPKHVSFLNDLYYYGSPQAKRIFFTVFERMQDSPP